MKKTFTLLLILSMTLLGCTPYSNSSKLESRHCRELTYQMYAKPHRYQAEGNKHLATTQAKLLKEYQRYRCGQ